MARSHLDDLPTAEEMQPLPQFPWRRDMNWLLFTLAWIGLLLLVYDSIRVE